MKDSILKLVLFIVLGLTAAVFASCGNGNATQWVEINGVKWAIRNVDAPGTFAATPESAGMFYQWNRNVGWSSTDPMINSNGDTTWNTTIPEGTEWEKANDPSPVGFRIPTRDEINSLLDEHKVSSEWTTQNGVNGRTFTDKTTGATLFLPAAGFRYNSNGALAGVGSFGYRWSSTQFNDSNAYYLFFNSGYADADENYRIYGFSVRSVKE